jgi:hypothetical protein
MGYRRGQPEVGGWMDGEENDKQSDLYGQLQFHYTTTLFVAASHA